MTTPDQADRTDQTDATEGTPHRPSLRDRLRPLEILGLSGVFAGFIALVTCYSLQEWVVDWSERWPLWPIAGGIAFIVALVVIAMLALIGYEAPPAPSEKGVLGEHDERQARGDAADH